MYTELPQEPTSGNTQKGSKYRLLIQHACLLVAVAALFVALVMFNSGYDQIFNKFVKTVWTDHQYDSLTYEKRLEVKLGFTATYLHMLRHHTPSNAVILMPPDSVFFPAGAKSKFNPLVRNKRWASYFVYPRKLVYEEEQDSLPLYHAVTHVAIVNYWGYQKLNHTTSSRLQYTVLPR